MAASLEHKLVDSKVDKSVLMTVVQKADRTVDKRVRMLVVQKVVLKVEKLVEPRVE